MFVLGDPVLHVLPVNDRGRRTESKGVSIRRGARRRADAREMIGRCEALAGREVIIRAQRPEDKRCHVVTRPYGLKPFDRTREDGSR